ncbi:MAG: 30S ribosomal protein S16 [Pseudomonadota bacterium]|nr:30S ribosomal protein S16 [Pseudomonadota bacterium]
MVIIRLSRAGIKKRPFYHLVVTDSRNKRDGRYIERVGFFNPSGKESEEDINIDQDRINYWVERGAQISDRVKKLLKLQGLSKEERDNLKSAKAEKRRVKRLEKKAKEESKEEAKEESKEEPKEEAKEEAKEESKEESKEEPKEEAKEESKEEPKEEKK